MSTPCCGCPVRPFFRARPSFHSARKIARQRSSKMGQSLGGAICLTRKSIEISKHTRDFAEPASDNTASKIESRLRRPEIYLKVIASVPSEAIVGRLAKGGHSNGQVDICARSAGHACRLRP